MTDSVPEDQTTATPPPAHESQNKAKSRVKWTREQRLAAWSNAASFVNAAAAAAAFALLFLTLRATQDSLTAAHKAVAEAHEQAVQARRQADIAQQSLIAATRARLKLAAITAASVRKPEGVDVAWFNFTPSYKNFGQAPAQNIFFALHIFVVGARSASKETCEGDKRLSREALTEIVFPQDVGGGDNTGVQVPLQELEAQAAEVRAVQPSAPVYLGVIGCLIYQSTDSADTYVTGFSGDLHQADKGTRKPRPYVPLYDLLMKGGRPIEVGMKLNTLSAWAD